VEKFPTTRTPKTCIHFKFISIVSIILYALGYDAATGKSIQPQDKQSPPPSYFQTQFTSPPIPPKFLPEVVTNETSLRPIEEKNMYLIVMNPVQHVVHKSN
jgi:hypothetical protein